MIGGNTAGTFTAFGFGASWDVTPLLTPMVALRYSSKSTNSPAGTRSRSPTA